MRATTFSSNFLNFKVSKPLSRYSMVFSSKYQTLKTKLYTSCFLFCHPSFYLTHALCPGSPEGLFKCEEQLTKDRLVQLLGPSSRSHRSAFLTQSSEEHIPPSPDYWLLPWLPFPLQSLPSSLFILPSRRDLGSMSFPVGFNLCSLFQGLYSPHQPDLLISPPNFPPAPVLVNRLTI